MSMKKVLILTLLLSCEAAMTEEHIVDKNMHVFCWDAFVKSQKIIEVMGDDSR